MAVTSSPVALKEKEVVEKRSRSKRPGVRVVGGRIYDSDNGKTCHQCRQKTMDFAAACAIQKGNKLCTLKFCHKCLLNRYGEKAEDVALLDDWQCPKCRGICNCSFCMKKRGHKPTGILVYTAKENGFCSVSELLQIKGSENLNHNKDVKASDGSSKSASSYKESTVASPWKPGKENSFDGNIETNLHPQNLTPISAEKKSKKTKRKGLKEVGSGNRDAEINLEESGQKKTKREGLGKVSNGSTKGGYKKPLITEDVYENEMKTNEKDKGDVAKEKKSKTKSMELSKDKVKENKKHEDVSEKKRKTKAHPQEISKKELKNGKNEDAFVEKRRTKTQPQEVSQNEVLLGANCNGGLVCGFRSDKIQTETKMAGDSCKVDKFPAESQTTANERRTKKLQNKEIDVDIQLPQGTCLTAVAGIELPPETVGNALQFLEFCASFGKVLGLKKGQAEIALREIINGRRGRRLQSYHLAQIHVQLLSLIQKDIGEESPTLTTTNENSWFQALRKSVSKCHFLSKELPSNCFDWGNEGYDKLNSSEKLRLLNLICDEALNTKELRSWIDDENSKFLERQKEAKEKVLAAKDKEKKLKQKMLDEVAKAIIEKNGAPISVSNHKEMVSRIKSEAAQAHSEMLEAMALKKGLLSNAVRTEPVLLDVDGRAFWKLNGYNGQSDILLQDMGTWNSVAPSEKWLVYADEQKLEIEKYITSSRTKRLRVQKASETPSIDALK
ncbi:hypothetical protein POPTR_018G024400v4 [Populus trichocarpa]|uniref:Uncharacterized protein n=2 Tax=Populus trichocarpa TaxID=3694 RepID=A0ACC0RM93_POPTR|nr:uncharacterized protein LOC7465401 [Populus trichocarpa]XP_024446495.2 uncharacterized protein LOC7465401 [Populus trichocarpa]KAI9378021.1 hypothetical protein POPTR_018G024400v4 [Populus trichocarpa]KAI9378022.1 hypothetical protein POPTR_018G024400v4 [Populus trichocarpa]